MKNVCANQNIYDVLALIIMIYVELMQKKNQRNKNISASIENVPIKCLLHLHHN